MNKDRPFSEELQQLIKGFLANDGDFGILRSAMIVRGIEIEWRNIEVIRDPEKTIEENKKTIAQTIKSTVWTLGKSFVKIHPDGDGIIYEKSSDHAIGEDKIVGFVDSTYHVDTIRVRFNTDDTVIDQYANQFEGLIPKPKGHIIKHLDAGPMGSVDVSKRVIQYQEAAEHPEFYPFLKENSPMELWDKFKASKSDLLLMLGPPGTGKTNICRTFMGFQSRAGGDVINVTNQQVAMNKDFISYLRDLENDTLVVIEDTDELLSKREEGNSVMPALLNLLSGVSKTKIKMIVTSNITQLEDIEPALYRKGRTYKTLHFGNLTHDQAHKARAALDYDEVEFDENEVGETLTLADALNY